MMKKKKPEFPSDVKRKVIERSGNRCERCKVDFDDNFKGEFHHIIPVIFGGKYTLDNCSLLCKQCHHIAPTIKNKNEIVIFKDYFLKFASFKEAAQYYKVDNRFDLSIKAALDLSKIYKKR